MHLSGAFKQKPDEYVAMVSKELKLSNRLFVGQFFDLRPS